ncbi:peptide deformylase [Clostridium sp. DL1XJH146]
MAVKEIVTVENPVLRRKSRRITEINAEVKNLIKDLKDTLYAGDGVGLAAPQIGVLMRVFIVDLREGDGATVIINPKITKKVGKHDDIEGCLSYPGYEGTVTRPKKIVIVGQNEKGNLVKYEVSGLLARAFCHETDHLDGIMYMDMAKKVYKIE